MPVACGLFPFQRFTQKVFLIGIHLPCTIRLRTLHGPMITIAANRRMPALRRRVGNFSTGDGQIQVITLKDAQGPSRFDFDAPVETSWLRLKINSVYGLRRAVEAGLGIASLPDYIVGKDSNLVQIDLGSDMPRFDTYLVYAEELRDSKRVAVFRDHAVLMARQWSF